MLPMELTSGEVWAAVWALRDQRWTRLAVQIPAGSGGVNGIMYLSNLSNGDLREAVVVEV